MNDYRPARSEERSNLILGCCCVGRCCWQTDSHQESMWVLWDVRVIREEQIVPKVGSHIRKVPRPDEGTFPWIRNALITLRDLNDYRFGTNSGQGHFSYMWSESAGVTLLTDPLYVFE
jgi:hypothetical protein